MDTRKRIRRAVAPPARARTRSTRVGAECDVDMLGIGGGPLVPQYLMSSYLYEVEGVSVLSDSDFDLVCRKLLRHWGGIKHKHKELISVEALRAGSGYGYDFELWPTIIISAARAWRKNSRDTE